MVKKLSYLFAALAVLLSDVMCAVVAFHYSRMLYGAEVGYSAPASVAFLYAVPYIIGIAICVAAAWMLKKAG